MSSLQGKKLVIFDLDGTLAPSKQPMTHNMSVLVSDLIKQIKVAVISGGGFPQFKTQFIASLPNSTDGFSNLYLLPTSGTKFYIWKGNWTELYNEEIPADERKNIIRLIKNALRLAQYEPPEKIFGELIEDRGSQITFSGLGQEAPLVLKEKWDPDRSKRQKIASYITDKLQGFDVRIGGATSIDITKKGINKAYGIHKLEEHLHIPIKEMLYVGDALFYGGNDYPAKATGIDCVQVADPFETEKLIRSWFE